MTNGEPESYTPGRALLALERFNRRYLPWLGLIVIISFFPTAYFFLGWTGFELGEVFGLVVLLNFVILAPWMIRMVTPMLAILTFVVLLYAMPRDLKVSLDFYAAVAQLIPVLLIALGLELRVFGPSP